MLRPALLTLLVACGPRAAEGPPPERAEPHGYPTTLVPPSRIEGDFLVEQEVSMTHPRGENTFRAVLQKQGARLILLGLAPHGGRAFLLEQTDDGVRFESYMPFELPFPPEYMLHDIHRAWFMEAPEGVVERDGERLEERREGGRVVERTYRRLDGRPPGTITVRYEGGLAPGAPRTAAPPARIVLNNGWFGYRATIRTLRWQPL